MSGIYQFKTLPQTIHEVENQIKDLMRKSSSCWAHYIHRAKDHEHEKYKKFKQAEARARMRLARLKAKAEMQNEKERQLREALK
jgi:hypothetical protein